MAKKDVQDLKRPDLKGQFTCGSCGQLFLHAASLNRHRRDKHNNEHTCMLCNTKLEPTEDLRDHMKNLHSIEKVYTCGCCNYSFDHKKFLHEHTKSIKETGQPGDFPAIAKSSNAPGSLLTHRFSPYSILRQSKGGSMSPPNSSASTSPSTSPSGTSSQEVSPKPANEEEKVAEEDQLKFYERQLNAKVEQILDTGIFPRNTMTIPETYEKVLEIAVKLLVEDFKKQAEVIANINLII